MRGADIAGGALPDNRVLLILAADHRDSLERGLYGLTAPPTPAQAARISADKLLVYQALLDAAAWLPAQIQPGVLIDEQYGAGVAELASHSAGTVSLCMRPSPGLAAAASPQYVRLAGPAALLAGGLLLLARLARLGFLANSCPGPS